MQNSLEATSYLSLSLSLSSQLCLCLSLQSILAQMRDYSKLSGIYEGFHLFQGASKSNDCLTTWSAITCFQMVKKVCLLIVAIKFDALI